MIKIKVRGVILDKETWKVFLCGDWSFLCLPWWTLEPGETREETLIREFQEELWIVPIIWKLLYINEFTGDNKTTVDFWYEIVNIEDFQNINLANVPLTEVTECWFYLLERDLNYKPEDLWDILKNI